MVSTLAILALASSVLALKVTSPDKSSVWTVGDSETISWEAVSSDQDSFNIYLSNMASYPSTTILLASNVASSSGSAKVDGSKLKAGKAYTINFTNGTETEQIYAQSSQFNITESTSSSSSSSAGSSSTSSSESSTKTGTATTTSSSSSSSSASETTETSTTDKSSSATTTDSSSSSSSSDSTASATGTSSASAHKSSSTGSATGSKTSSTETPKATSGAGKVVAGWVGLAAAAAMAL